MDKLVECVPNFSEGRRPEVIEAIESSIVAPSLTHTFRPRIEFRIVACRMNEPAPIRTFSISPPTMRAGGPWKGPVRMGQWRLSRSRRGSSPRRSMCARQ